MKLRVSWLLLVLVWIGVINLATRGSRLVHNFQAVIITSPSMESSIKPGSVVVIRSLKPWQYKVGDVVTYMPPGQRTYITHRITAKVSKRDVPLIKTKGDANTNGDPWYAAVGSIRGKVVLNFPWVGYWLTDIRKFTRNIYSYLLT